MSTICVLCTTLWNISGQWLTVLDHETSILFLPGAPSCTGITSLRQAVMEAALQKPAPIALDVSSQASSDAEHYFTPISPFNANCKSTREVVFVAMNTNQPATYTGKGSSRPLLPSKQGDKEMEERRGYGTDSQAILQKMESPNASKGFNFKQPHVNGTWRSSEEVYRRRRPPEPRMELHVPDLRPLSPPLLLDFSTLDGSYDDLLGMQLPDPWLSPVVHHSVLSTQFR